MGVSENVVHLPVMAFFYTETDDEADELDDFSLDFFWRSQHLASRRDDQHAVEYSTPTWRNNFGCRFRRDLSDQGVR